jgi:predicted nuclease of predicted toxin-antitoxin system
MRFLADQNLERRVARYLIDEGHDVTIGGINYDAGLPDTAVLDLARREGRILITNDRDFGELIWRQRLPHSGVIFFRMLAATAEQKIARLRLVLQEYADQLDQFIVVSATRVRIRRVLEDEPPA